MGVAMKKIVLSRKGLYDIIWSVPISCILKKYEISPGELRGILKEMRIPLPDVGYWQKIQYGKQVEIKELPNEYSAKIDFTLTVRNKNSLFNKSPQNL
jgi:replicative superfamily II helicase